MTTYAVTGATGGFGNLVVRALLRDGVPAGDIVAVVRNPDKAADLSALGVQVRTADYSQPQTLPAALAGVDRVLLVSGSEVGARVAQHGAVIDAAKAAGASLLVYTSAPRADTTALPLAPEHKATEELVRASGIPFVVLRNNWYLENYTGQIAQYIERGAIVDATGSGRVAGAARADYADAAAAVLIASGPQNATYELGGPAFSIDDLAAAVSEAAGVEVRHTSVSPDELIGILTGAGLDPGTAQFVAALDQSIANGDLDSDGTDLERLIGRPTTPLIDAVRAAV
jgi:NAD(P)H dehydrogenase (quinone)